MHIIFIEFFHGKTLEYINTLRCSCANEISFMYKINLSRSPRFLPDVKMASKDEDERGICENIPFLGQIRLP